MPETLPQLQALEIRTGLPFTTMRAMAAELCDIDFDPQLLNTEQLFQGLGKLGVNELGTEEMQAVTIQHAKDQEQFKGIIDIPFSSAERKISRQIFDKLVPLKHPDQYLPSETILYDFTDKEEAQLAPAVLGRLGVRSLLEVDIRYSRKRRGNFQYTKWPTSQHRRDYRYMPDTVLGSLREPKPIVALARRRHL